MTEVLDPTIESARPGSYGRYLGRIAVGEKLAPKGKKEFLARFEWRPHWKAEVSLALEGLQRKMTSDRNEYGLSAAYYDWDNAKRYREEALRSYNALSLANNRSTVGGVNVDIVRNDGLVMSQLAEHLIAVQSLDSFDWKPHFTKGRPSASRKRKINEAMADLAGLEGVDLAAFWEVTQQSQINRLLFWSEQLADMRGTPLVDEIQEAINNAELVSQQEIDDYVQRFYEEV